MARVAHGLVQTPRPSAPLDTAKIMAVAAMIKQGGFEELAELCFTYEVPTRGPHGRMVLGVGENSQTCDEICHARVRAFATVSGN